MDPTLEAAYRATDYRVEDPAIGPFVIRIDEPCPEADRVLARVHKSEWTFLTACNPSSQRLTDVENAGRMARLQAVCVDRGWTPIVGAGVGRDGTWPPEPSVFIVGASEAEAVEVARSFGQNAIVAGRMGEPARLVWVE